MKKKIKCTICNDTGEFTNCFDQTFKCSCNVGKKKQKKWEEKIIINGDFFRYRFPEYAKYFENCKEIKFFAKNGKMEIKSI